jgi:hypothetical protein
LPKYRRLFIFDKSTETFHEVVFAKLGLRGYFGRSLGDLGDICEVICVGYELLPAHLRILESKSQVNNTPVGPTQ